MNAPRFPLPGDPQSLSALQKLFDSGAVWQPTALSTETAIGTETARGTETALGTETARGTASALGAPRNALGREGVGFGIPEIDALLPRGILPGGHLHEWALENELSCRTRNRWHPPLIFLTALLSRAFFSHSEGSKRLTVWIGRKCWPTPHLMAAMSRGKHPPDTPPWESRCLFIDPVDREQQLWSFIRTLSSPAVGAVIGDASKLHGTALRRMQLAAERGNTLGLLVRPPWELSHASNVFSRWKILPARDVTQSTAPHQTRRPSKSHGQREFHGQRGFYWSLQLLKLRGAVETSASEQYLQQWHLQWEMRHGTGSLSSTQTGSSGAHASAHDEAERNRNQAREASRTDRQEPTRARRARTA
ncbi:MAG: hypothetical protein KDD69_06555 [Bdellovibrionales bacterium]|nr:hypothetical protein [Bdellovibrionales bacterium]